MTTMTDILNNEYSDTLGRIRDTAHLDRHGLEIGVIDDAPALCIYETVWPDDGTAPTVDVISAMRYATWDDLEDALADDIDDLTSWAIDTMEGIQA
ncbi:hypothetical protein JS532_08455 [Bifidobacterium callimiconis]|uniref:hypothetical protein n=1 Tax=Bifidobacterium callimiconis TaxID=2306973 RepID=UPI001BDD668B|nr:hypothetical protein [Bifidobacterium callimiconis]MBT1177591.1 hypothetical protein [Bifidobacterium callimiconis]